jgi:alpha-mannosidase
VRHALLPHAGDQRPVVAPADALNAPIVLRPAGGDRAVRVGLVEIDEPGIVVEAVKRADESDGVVVRVYESLGGRRRGALRTVWPVSEVTEVDLLERPIGEAIPVTGDRVDVELRPFEIRTLLLT